MSLLNIKIKDIKTFLKVNKSIEMPMISKKESGELVADGFVQVKSYAEYTAQLKLYEEYLKYLATVYNAEIPKIFKAALAKTIILRNDGLTSKRLHQKEMTESQYESFSSDGYFRTLCYISDAAVQKRILKPASVIKTATNSSDRSMQRGFSWQRTYVMPVIGENGVIVKRRGDVRGQLQAKTVALNSTDMVNIRDALLRDVKELGIEGAEQLIHEIFDLSGKAGVYDKKNIINDESKKLRRELVLKCVELFGVDISQYERSTDVAELALDGKDPVVSQPESDEIVFDLSEVKVVIEGGKMVIKKIENEAANEKQ